jgi:hypothetical protein
MRMLVRRWSFSSPLMLIIRLADAYQKKNYLSHCFEAIEDVFRDVEAGPGQSMSHGQHDQKELPPHASRLALSLSASCDRRCT